MLKNEGGKLEDFRCAGDTVIFADSLNSLQQLVSRTNESNEHYGTEMNIGKTKLMIIGKKDILSS